MTFLMLVLLLTMPGSEQAVRVVENPIKPTGTAQTITFEKEWSTGADREDSHYLWSGASVGAVINKAGHAFILDRGDNRIIELDEKGDFVKQIGQKGLGPGEFNMLTNISLLDDGGLVVHEYNLGTVGISFFDKTGSFLNRHGNVETKIPILSSQFSPNGKLISSTFFSFQENNTLIMKYAVLGSDYKPLLILGEELLPNMDGNRVGEAAWWVEFLTPWFSLISRQGMMAFATDGSVFTATGNLYEVTRYNTDMKPTLKFGRKYKPRFQSEQDIDAMLEPVREEVLANLPPNFREMVTDTVIEKAVAAAQLPPAQAAIFGILPMENGGVLVVHNYDPQSRRVDGDIFDKDGLFLGTCQLPPAEIGIFAAFNGYSAKAWFRNGKLYTIENNEGDYSLVRYKYSMHEVK